MPRKMASSPETAPPPDSRQLSPPAPPADSPPPKASPPPPASAPPPQDAQPPPADATPPAGAAQPPSSKSPAPSSNAPPSTGKSPPSSSSPSPPPPPSNMRSPPSPKALSPPPPPPRSSKSSPPSRGSTSNGSSSAPSKSSSGVNVPLVVGITAGVVLFLVLMVFSFLFCCKKKRKRPHDAMHYYVDHSNGGSLAHKGGGGGGGDYYIRGGPPKWNGSVAPPSRNHRVDMVHPPLGMMSSSEMSSGPHGPALPPPPPPPGISLGFNKSTFTYDELAAATEGFSRGNLLGQGGFGYVHKGVLPNGKEVAVKSLKSGSGQGEREFQAEVEIISRVHHRHLVSLVGYCIAGGQRMLVYEFVPNKTLEYHLHGADRPTMDFPTRLKIALGAAKGLAYLHEDCHPRIIHRDIKAANILLDFNFEAMVADFGLAKLSSDNHTHVSTRVMGTFGYLAPEYASSGKLTEKSDVFSFGVMLLELIAGRRPVDTSYEDMDDSLVDWARPILTEALGDGNYDDLLDPRLGKDYNHAEMTRLVACAAASVRHSARRRPKMSQIVRALEGDSSLEDLNEGVRPGHSTVFGSSNGSTDYDTSSYASDMKRFNKVALASQEFGSSEFGGTGEFTSSDTGNSREMHPVGNKRNLL